MKLINLGRHIEYKQFIIQFLHIKNNINIFSFI